MLREAEVERAHEKEAFMSLQDLEAKSELKQLVDTFSNLGDEKRIKDQMSLFDISGVEQLEETFSGFIANVTRLFHMNGQQVVDIDGDSATGISYCQVKLVTEEDGKEFITDSSIRYNDEYVQRDGRWLIKTRISHFLINDKRPLGS
ncbi:nuclear transport factor 2 family protein [Streptomyces fulvoviolaceus]|uniref:nuclear transport factor 2 family protein n=1 Tax=Streptomyces fulvoviolaceus TaxID=285535 RepID=UPI0021BE344F|nr:nuclear transport factor 2 family protein [Streptomyces fulvoviolaceus]MCT9075210.1 nuclear transport factor 2 family protein [Streptomyces fulvoviolaceus]